jgi:transcriptional regulator with XRE-family HTH domain
MERDEATMLVAHNIASIMEAKGTNAAEVARRAGLNHTGVYDIISGKSRNPRLDTIHKIATKGLGVPLSALFLSPDMKSARAEIMACFQDMPHEDQERLLTIARALAAQPSKP